MTEELEAEPAFAAELFGDTLPKARAFTEALAKHGEELGLIGPLELPRLWTRHIINSGSSLPCCAQAESAMSDQGPDFPDSCSRSPGPMSPSR